VMGWQPERGRRRRGEGRDFGWQGSERKAESEGLREEFELTITKAKRKRKVRSMKKVAKMIGIRRVAMMSKRAIKRVWVWRGRWSREEGGNRGRGSGKRGRWGEEGEGEEDEESCYHHEVSRPSRVSILLCFFSSAYSDLPSFDVPKGRWSPWFETRSSTRSLPSRNR